MSHKTKKLKRKLNELAFALVCLQNDLEAQKQSIRAMQEGNTDQSHIMSDEEAERLIL